MGKTVLSSKFTELKGLDRISTVVHEEMRCLFREITKDDVGIDGEIEVLAPKADGRGYETTGGFIKVQSKSGATYVKENTSTSFSTPVEEGDLKYWYSVTYPVIFVVYHPDDDRLYWKDVRAYVRSAPQVWQRPFKIVFDKAADLFSGVATDAILTLGNASPPRVSTQERERLFTNLLLVKRVPPVITSAVAKVTDYRPSEHKYAAPSHPSVSLRIAFTPWQISARRSARCANSAISQTSMMCCRGIGGQIRHDSAT